MTPNYIDFVFFCIFVLSIAYLIKNFYNIREWTREEKNKFIEKFTGLEKSLLQLLSIGWVMTLLISFYHGFLLWLTYKSFFKVISLLISQI